MSERILSIIIAGRLPFRTVFHHDEFKEDWSLIIRSGSVTLTCWLPEGIKLLAILSNQLIKKNKLTFKSLLLFPWIMKL